MSDRLRELTAFVRAGETGSFSRVARELGVSQPSISRMVADLEARLLSVAASDPTTSTRLAKLMGELEHSLREAEYWST